MKKLATTAFDIAEYLDDEHVIAEYLAAAAGDENPYVFLAALGHVAKARGMTDIAQQTGLGRESLYKSFGKGAKPRFETIQSVLHAMGLKLHVVPVAKPDKGARKKAVA